jgi:hypothetical protein
MKGKNDENDTSITQTIHDNLRLLFIGGAVSYGMRRDG